MFLLFLQCGILTAPIVWYLNCPRSLVYYFEQNRKHLIPSYFRERPNVHKFKHIITKTKKKPNLLRQREENKNKQTNKQLTNKQKQK